MKNFQHRLKQWSQLKVSRHTLTQNTVTVFIGFHLVIISLVSMYSAADSYVSFYKDELKDEEYPRALEWARNLLTLKCLHFYTVIGGVDAGYGFFAPNVASEYILDFALQNDGQPGISHVTVPKFSSKEAFLKYTTMLGSFQEKLKFLSDSTNSSSKSSPLYQRYLDVLIKSMGKQMMAADTAITNITVTLYLYDYPSLKNSIRSRGSASLVEIQKFSITKTDQNEKD